MNGEVRRDLRAEISVKADQALEAVSLATGRTKQELVRAVLDKWADEEIHRATLLLRLAACDGRPRSVPE